MVNLSVVVTAGFHNPTVLHPSFLASQGIVPSGWTVAEPPISTPAFSNVKYNEGIQFTVEPEKLQVLDGAPDNPKDTQIPSLAKKYLDSLPHVRYTGTGINLLGLLECDDPRQAIIEKYLRPGPWTMFSSGIKALGFRAVYDVHLGTLVVSVDPGEATFVRRSEKSVGIAVNANYHHVVEGGVDDAKKSIDLFVERYNHYLSLVDALFATEVQRHA